MSGNTYNLWLSNHSTVDIPSLFNLLIDSDPDGACRPQLPSLHLELNLPADIFLWFFRLMLAELFLELLVSNW